jgi:hypothetical protein
MKGVHIEQISRVVGVLDGLQSAGGGVSFLLLGAVTFDDGTLPVIAVMLSIEREQNILHTPSLLASI